jgi:hypothetical protein
MAYRLAQIGAMTRNSAGGYVHSWSENKAVRSPCCVALLHLLCCSLVTFVVPVNGCIYHVDLWTCWPRQCTYQEQLLKCPFGKWVNKDHPYTSLKKWVFRCFFKLTDLRMTLYESSRVESCEHRMPWDSEGWYVCPSSDRYRLALDHEETWKTRTRIVNSTRLDIVNQWRVCSNSPVCDQHLRGTLSEWLYSAHGGGYPLSLGLQNYIQIRTPVWLCLPQKRSTDGEQNSFMLIRWHLQHLRQVNFAGHEPGAFPWQR